MSIKDLTITDQTVQGIYVQSQPDRLTGTAQQNKAVFDAYPALIKQRFNQLLELLTAEGGAGEIPVGPIEGVTAQNVQQALAAIQKNLTAYINKLKATTGAAEVGVSTISGISAGNVQNALEGLRAIQIALDSNIQKLMSANGAAAVGVSAISGMQAQNVQKALEELRKAIDDSVSGIIPGGSIKPDMIDGPIPIKKGGTEANTMQKALARLGAGVRPNELDNACFVGGGTGWGVFPVNQRGKTSYSVSENQNVFDRWKLVDNQASVELVEDGIIIRDSKEITGNKIALQQSLHNALYNDFFTMSCIIKEMKGSWFFACTSFDSIVPVTVGINEAIIPKENAVLPGRDFYFFKASSGVDDYIKIQAVKIERGEGQTLAYEDVDGVHLLPQSDSDYATQNMRCRSYYRRYGYGLTAMVKNSILIFNIPFDVPMRVVPVCNVLQQNITMIGGDVGYPISISSTYVTGLGNGIEIICNVEFTGEVPQLGSVLLMNTPLADIFELSSEL
ncbi:hypothetical protein [Candidatus Agathobaculum pullicola]|uniref:hypothetical protein n=1 Tax=Candidatus Agathobaculum pullicola TaxID=2838426 RepID=UPI003F91FA9C